MKTDTPRTNENLEDARNVALEFTNRSPAPTNSENCWVVLPDVARELERELNGFVTELGCDDPQQPPASRVVLAMVKLRKILNP